MTQRGVQPELHIASATGPNDIEYAAVAPSDEVVFRLFEIPVATSASGFGEEAVVSGAAA